MYTIGLVESDSGDVSVGSTVRERLRKQWLTLLGRTRSINYKAYLLGEGIGAVVEDV